MITLTLYFRYTIGLLVFIAGSVVTANMAFAGEITYPADSYNTGDTLTADDLNAKFNEIKSAVNNNNNLSSLSDLSCTDGHVAKWNGTAWACAADIDSAGVEFASSIEDNIVLPDGENFLVQSVEVSAPGPGYIIVSFSATYRIRHTNGNVEWMEIGIWESDGSLINDVVITDLPSRRIVFLDSGFANGNFYGSVASHQVFQVLTGGVHNFFVLGRSHYGQTPPLELEWFSVSHPATQAVFVPNRY